MLPIAVLGVHSADRDLHPSRQIERVLDAKLRRDRELGARWLELSTATAAPTSLTAALADGQYQVGINALPSGGRSDYVELYRDATFELALGRHFDKLGRPDVRGDRTDKPIDSVAPPNANVTPFVFEDYAYDNFSSPAPLFSAIASNSGGMLVDRNANFDITAAPRLLGDTKINGEIFGRDTAGRITSSFASFRAGLVDSFGQPVTRSAGTGIGYKATGQIDHIFGSAADEVFTYDQRGLLSERQVSFEELPNRKKEVGTFRYSYDAVGRNTLLVYPEGHTRTQEFDAVGRLKSRCYKYVDAIALSGRVITTPERCYTATYDAVGNPKVLTDPEIRQEIDYDSLDRVIEVRRFVPPSSSAPAYVESYAYNALGGFKIYDGTVVDDKRPRLDGNGTAVAAIPATHSGSAVSLDRAGRITALGHQTFQYFSLGNRIQSIVDGTDTTRFGYDPLGRSVGQDVITTGVRRLTAGYIYDGAGENIASIDGSALQPGNNTELDSQSLAWLYDGIDQPFWGRGGHNTYYFELDTIGNVRRLHSSQYYGGLDPEPPPPQDLGGYAYSAFGKPLGPSDPGGLDVPRLEGDLVYQTLRWQGHISLGGTATLYDFRARIWSPDLGAFLQADEYAFLSSAGTLWSWPGQNPFRWRDPSGRGVAGWLVGGLVGGVLGAEAGAGVGLLVGGGSTIEFGPAAVVGASGGALVGTVAGAGLGAYYLGKATSDLEDAIGDALQGIFLAKAKSGGGRSRFRRGRDVSDQLEDILDAQAAKRKQGRACEIESTKKSEQRDRNALKRIESEDDAQREFGDDD